jgi:hypothetical protein
MREPRSRCAASHACSARYVGVCELRYLMQIYGLSDKGMGCKSKR